MRRVHLKPPQSPRTALYGHFPNMTEPWGPPRDGCRALFVHVRAPYAALSLTAVSHVVVRACERAGLPSAGAHRLRHAAATAMRRAGAALFEIGQILRHQHTVTTAGYARDDQDTLATIARRWPGGAA